MAVVTGTLRHKDNVSVSIRGELRGKSMKGNLQFRIEGTTVDRLFEAAEGFYFEEDYRIPTEPGIYVDYKPGIKTEYLDVYYLRQDGWMNPRHGTAVLSSVIESAFKRRKTDLRRLTLPPSWG